MSSDRPNKSNRAGATWTIALVVVIPLLYLLSVMPLVCANFRDPVFSRWLTWYRKPHDWVLLHTPLQEPLGDYGSFYITTFYPEYTLKIH